MAAAQIDTVLAVQAHQLRSVQQTLSGLKELHERLKSARLKLMQECAKYGEAAAQSRQLGSLGYSVGTETAALAHEFEQLEALRKQVGDRPYHYQHQHQNPPQPPPPPQQQEMGSGGNGMMGMLLAALVGAGGGYLLHDFLGAQEEQEETGEGSKPRTKTRRGRRHAKPHYPSK